MRTRGLLLSLAICLSHSAVAVEFDFRGSTGLELKGFTQDPLQPVQHGSTGSLALQPELFWSWNEGDDSLSFIPFGRLDSGDDERSHADIRELLWLHVGNGWEFRGGIGKVFWGVTESIHLVDIVNQTDLVESIDQEEKLGQPMLWLSLPKDFGTVDFFALPGFRERTFPGEEGRFRTTLVVDTDLTTYESEDGDEHIDYALRWSHYVGPVDFGLSWFSGTSRDPDYRPAPQADGSVVLAPHYPLIDQYSIDIQSVLDAWLLKLEYIYRDPELSDSYSAAIAGFEYTLGSIFDSRYDLGIILEYLYDSRDDAAAGPFQDDLFAGFRLAFNDAQSSELLFGVIGDLHNGSRLFNLEAARRLGDNWKVSLEARAFSSIPETDPLFSQRQDDYIQLNLEYFF